MNIGGAERSGERPQQRRIEDLTPLEKELFAQRAFARVNLLLSLGRNGQLSHEDAVQMAISTGKSAAIEEDINTYGVDAPLGAEAYYNNPTFRLVQLYLRLSPRR